MGTDCSCRLYQYTPWLEVASIVLLLMLRRNWRKGKIYAYYQELYSLMYEHDVIQMGLTVFILDHLVLWAL